MSFGTSWTTKVRTRDVVFRAARERFAREHPKVDLAELVIQQATGQLAPPEVEPGEHREDDGAEERERDDVDFGAAEEPEQVLSVDGSTVFEVEAGSTTTTAGTARRPYEPDQPRVHRGTNPGVRTEKPSTIRGATVWSLPPQSGSERALVDCMAPPSASRHHPSEPAAFVHTRFPTGCRYPTRATR